MNHHLKLINDGRDNTGSSEPADEGRRPSVAPAPCREALGEAEPAALGGTALSGEVAVLGGGGGARQRRRHGASAGRQAEHDEAASRLHTYTVSARLHTIRCCIFWPLIHGIDGWSCSARGERADAKETVVGTSRNGSPEHSTRGRRIVDFPGVEHRGAASSRILACIIH
jgi:hypothetical protein